MNSMLNFFSQQGGPMGMGFFANMANWFNQFTQFARNPIGAIMSMRGVNIPQNFNGTPEDLAKHLINTNQMPQQQFQQFSQIANQMQNMLPKF